MSAYASLDADATFSNCSASEFNTFAAKEAPYVSSVRWVPLGIWCACVLTKSMSLTLRFNQWYHNGLDCLGTSPPTDSFSDGRCGDGLVSGAEEVRTASMVACDSV